MADLSAATLAMQNRGPPVLTVTIVMICLSTVFVALRLVSRAGIVKRISNDDYAIILAWIIAFGFSLSVCYGTSIGLGRHEENIPDHKREPLRKAEYAFTVLYNPALMATKTSICLFYLTLSKNHKVFKYLTLGTFAVVNIAGVALTFLNIFQCRPFGDAFKDPPPHGAHCIDIVELYLSSAPVNIVTDLALLFLPMPILTGMRLPRNEKLILIITFSFGGFVAVVDVIRIAYLESAATARLSNKTQPGGSNQYGDYSWVVSLSFMWSVVEVHVGMICASVPGLKPLAAKFAPSLLGRIKSSRNMNGNPFYGPGDAQWADLGRASQNSNTIPAISRPPLSPVPAKTPTLPQNDIESQDRESEDQHPSMNMLDFLTTPDMTGVSQHQNRFSGTTEFSPPISPTAPRGRSNSLHNIFDFVDMKNPKSMVKMTNRESLFPNSLVTILFFLWGFAYGLLDVLNSQFQKVTNISSGSGRAIGLHSAYYGAYLIAPLTFGGYVFRRHGFKSTFMVGLCVYGVGTLVFWPSAVLASFPAFFISNFIIGLGVATLETAGNPFISLCGPPEYAEVRLNISQGVQAIGSVLSPILAEKVLFKNVKDTTSLVEVQWTYLGIALFDVILALIFFYLPIPEASDADLDAMACKRSAINNSRILSSLFPSRNGVAITSLTLALGCFSQFCYVGAQEATASFFQTFVTRVRPTSTLSPFDYLSVAHACFAFGRFLTAFMGIWLKPRHLLFLGYVGAFTAAACAMSTSSYTAVACLILVLFFESGIFSLIFSISLRGLGGRTKWGAMFLAASTSGGALVPGVMSPVRSSRGVQYAFAVVVAVFAFGTTFPLYLETTGQARRQVDPVHRSRRSNVLRVTDEEKEENEQRQRSESRKRKRRRTFVINRRGSIFPREEDEEKSAGKTKEKEKEEGASLSTAESPQVASTLDMKLVEGDVIHTGKGKT
ncbi:uncharacterized protein KY384_006795 [Bacidia gigantensis]|uniref:uncharacterized protein n=1 Tax=Bacidia gigantensis TaxID=2732470 RepID=UPI001D04ED79|nr:uncharacterized protein KY384_006795 [Bacidia gigantensis]KAG8527879.1 hypothetical protein KY384_006795 [Bacidia gigantensis]